MMSWLIASLGETLDRQMRSNPKNDPWFEAMDEPDPKIRRAIISAWNDGRPIPLSTRQKKLRQQAEAIAARAERRPPSVRGRSRSEEREDTPNACNHEDVIEEIRRLADRGDANSEYLIEVLRELFDSNNETLRDIRDGFSSDRIGRYGSDE